MRDWPWSELDLDPTADRAAIKRAYAAKLKTLDRERDVEGFQALREAYEAALSIGGVGEASRETVRIADHGTHSIPPAHGDVARTVFGSAGSESRTLFVGREPPQTSPEAVAQRLVSLILDSGDVGTLESQIDSCPELLDLAMIDLVALDLFQLLEHRRLSPPVMDALAQRFGWRDYTRLKRWQFDELQRLQSWLGIHDLEQLAVPKVMGGHLWFVKHKLRPPLDAWRAFVLSATTIVDARKPVHALYRFLGTTKAEAMLPRNALRFVDAVETGNGDWRISVAAWLGGALKWIVVGLCCTSMYRWMADERLPSLAESLQDVHGLALFVLLMGALKRSSLFFQNMADDDLGILERGSWRGFWSRCLIYWVVWIPLAALV